MDHPFDEHFDESPLESAKALSDSTAIPSRAPLSRAGSQQAAPAPSRSSLSHSPSSSPTQFTNASTQADSFASPPQYSSPTGTRIPWGRTDSSTSLPLSSPPTLSRNPFSRQDSSSSVPIVVISRPRTPEATSPQEQPSRLGDYFPSDHESRIQYSDWDIQEISRHLRTSGNQAWCEVPRLYIVLRLIGQLHVLDHVLGQGIRDVFFPFSPSSVPEALAPPFRDEFLESQSMVLTKAVDLEKGKLKPHIHFDPHDTFPFEIKGKLGSGGYGTVDRIFSPFSRQEYARKRIKRKRGRSIEEAQSFINELQVLKRLNHPHCVELVASYTDAKYFGLIMSPVADCNLAEFYLRVPEDPRRKTQLRGFFGCLVTGLNYIHTVKIRHRDMKPENILVKGNSVYISDFGISLDWEFLAGSTTTGPTAKSWVYCAPEVAHDQRRNTSSDIWSLGCIFFEMCTVLKGQTPSAMRRYFQERSESSNFFQNTQAIESWSEELKAAGPESDNLPLSWTEWMMQANPTSRPSAKDLAVEITRVSQMNARAGQYVRECCATNSESDSTTESTCDEDIRDESLEDETTSRLRSPRPSDKSMKLVEGKPEPPIFETRVDNDSPTPIPPIIETTVVEKEKNRSGISTDEPADSSTSISPLGVYTGVPYPPFSRAHSREAVGIQVNNTDFRSSCVNPKQTEINSIIDSEPKDGKSNSADLPPIPLRPTGHQDPILETSEAGPIKQGYKRAVAEMATKLQASKESRGVSPSRDTPGTVNPIHIMGPKIIVDIPSGADNGIGNTRMQDIQRRRSTGSQNILPKLVPWSWTKPDRLFDKLKSDPSFMSFIELRYPDLFKLDSAAEPKEVDFLVELLLRYGLNVESNAYVDTNGISPIFSVLEWGEEYQVVLKRILRAGAKLQYETIDGRTPLTQAAACGYIWAIDILVHAGANVNSEIRRAPLVEAALRNQVKTVEHLVTKHQAMPDLKTTKGETALRAACSEGHLEVARFLLETCRDKIDIEARFKDQTLLLKACLEGKSDVAKLLLEHGADPNGGKDIKKMSYLHHAVRASDAEMVQCLLDHGADVSARSVPVFSGGGALGTTPISEAEKIGKAEINYMLLEAKKDARLGKERAKTSQKRTKIRPRRENSK